MISHYYLCCCSFLLFFPHVLRLWKKRTRGRPPGPRGTVLLGVAHLLPKTEPWKTYAAWGKLHQSPVVSFRVYNRRIVVLNSAEAVQALLERRQEIYSERPMSWMYNVICDRGKSVFNINSSDSRHRRYRKLIQNGLGARGIREYIPLIQAESMKLAEALVQDPSNLVRHVQRNSVSVILKIAFGYTIADLNDPFIKVTEEASQISGWALQPGRWLVDYVPLLRYVPAWLPGAGWKRQGLEWKERLRNLADVPHEWAKRQMETGDAVESFTSRLLRSGGIEVLSAEDEDIVKWCAGGLYAGAGDTTTSAIVSFILLMALYPGVQQRARDEVLKARIADDGRLPPLGDLHQLSYLHAVMREVLRFAPVANLALPHRVAKDDTYNGYHIPKDSTVIGNVWAILHDEDLYPDPFTFKPERFLAAQGTSPQPDPKRWVFGFGRRSCPGVFFAETTILYAMCSILRTCNISLPVGTPRPLVEVTTGITSHIQPFPIDVRST